MTTAHTIRLVLIALGGLSLMALPLLRHRIASMNTYPSWALVSWFIAGATALIYLGLGYFAHSLSAADRWLPLLTHLRSMIGGIGMGTILTLTIWYFLGYSRSR